MAVRLPVTVRAYLAADRVLATATHLHYLFWDEVLWAWTHSGQREAANEIIFGNSSTYLPGGNAFEEGLFGWEQTAIATPPFPQTGRILLGGAGGGRELNQLCMRGFDVVAFEPSARLFEGATQVVSKYPNSTIIRASYGDLVAAARELSGPLAHAVLNTSFDAVVFGWESLS